MKEGTCGKSWEFSVVAQLGVVEKEKNGRFKESRLGTGLETLNLAQNEGFRSKPPWESRAATLTNSKTGSNSEKKILKREERKRREE